jgi:hypothetical protein
MQHIEITDQPGVPIDGVGLARRMDLMSASTRTAQRTLGTSQLGGMIVLLAALAVIVAAIAFGTLSATKVGAPAAGAGANPVVDLVPRHEIGAPAAGAGANPVVDFVPRHEISAPKGTNPEPVPGYWRPDASGNWIFVPFSGTGKTDMSGGLVIGGNSATDTDEFPSLGGWNHPPVPSTGDQGGLFGPGLDAR